MKKQMWWLTSVGLVLALVAQYAIYSSEQPKLIGHASWDFAPTSFDQVVAKAQHIVEAEVIAVKAGPPIVTAAAGEPGGQDIIPTEHATVRIITREKGQIQEGQEVTVFRTGGQVNLPAGPARGDQPLDEKRGHERIEQPAGPKPEADPNLAPPALPARQPEAGEPARAQVSIFLLEEDPPYEVGARVYLALEPGPNNAMRPVSPSGRYRVQANGRLEAVGDDPVSRAVNGREIAEVKRAARGQGSIGGPGGAGGPGDRRETTGALPGMPTTGGHDHGFPWITFFWVGALMVLAGAVTGVASMLRLRRTS